MAIRKPVRMALSYLWHYNLDWEPDFPPTLAICAEERSILHAQLEHHLNSPPTSSMGRLFDAVSALVGVCQTNTYEGQAAMELEAVADVQDERFYTIDIKNDTLSVHPLLIALISDWRSGIPLPNLSARFHNSLVQVIIELCLTIREEHKVNTVALSGGVWQNQYLLKHAQAGLRQQGFQVLIHHQLPPNDGCIALGQALVAHYLTKD